MCYRLPLVLLGFIGLATPCRAELTELVDAPTLAAIAGEVSGLAAKRNLDTVTLYHRTRAGSQFKMASEHVLGQLQDYGFEDATMLEFPADGESMFGTQKSRPAWDVEFAELWELDASGNRSLRHASWAAMPLSLAQDSLSGSAETTLVDIGAGTNDRDYAGKDLRGRLVLTSSQPEDVAARAVGLAGAVGIVSYAPNQKTAWWKEDDQLVRWGHLSSFPTAPTFAFMVTLATARAWQARMAAGEEIRLSAEVKAEHSRGQYVMVTATIPGTDPAVAGEEIIFSCHLDHPRPGANDNASGCVSILEAARTLKRLVDLGTLPAPRRTLRFIWPAEIEGSIIYLVSLGDTRHIKSNIHLDMVGGSPETKAVFRVSGGPLSLPSFVSDVGHEIGQFVNLHTERFASGKDTSFPLNSAEGGKEPLLALMEGIDLGSDHIVFNEGSWRIPGIYLHDWPDRYIHTNFDSAANIDPTKLQRAAFIAMVQGWYLANFSASDVEAVLEMLKLNALRRAAETEARIRSLTPDEKAASWAAHWAAEQQRLDSIRPFAEVADAQRNSADAFLLSLAGLLSPHAAPAGSGQGKVWKRNSGIKGPMSAFGYGYLEDHLSAEEVQALTLDSTIAYEVLNLVDGVRDEGQIHAWLQLEFGAVEEQQVQQYLLALEKIGAIVGSE